jgi:hypothetical protein
MRRLPGRPYPDISPGVTFRGEIKMKSLINMKKIATIAVFVLLCGLAVTASGAMSWGFSSFYGNPNSPKILLPENSYHVSLPLVSTGPKTTILLLKSDNTELLNTQLQTVQVPVSPDSYTVTLLPVNSQSLIKGFSWKPAFPLYSDTNGIFSYTPVSPVIIPANTISPAQTSSGSGLGGLIILGQQGKYLINMKSNFYDASQMLYDGLWHQVGVTPRYWYNMFLPGSYTVQLVDKDTGNVAYCETVMVNPGMNTTIKAVYTACPFSNNCPDCC